MASVTHKGMYHGGLCLITDRNSCELTIIEMVCIALQAGVRWVQLRDKGMSRLSTFRTALALRELTLEYGAFFVVNDHADIAAAVGADGVHLGQDDLPAAEARKVVGRRMTIGVSTHNVREARLAEHEGADYIGFGPVFPTGTKAVGRPRGVEALMRINNEVSIPVVAIGGIDHVNCGGVFGSGASAVASAAGILGGDISSNATCFMRAVCACGKTA